MEILSAIGDFHKYTCLRFVPAIAGDKNYIKFQDGDECSSYVGMQGGNQSINLAPICRMVSHNQLLYPKQF